MNRYVQVITTVSKRSEADKIARVLIDKKLAACVQIIGPIKSAYRWKGRIENAKEWICLIKTRKTLYKKVESAIRKIHPYEVPEIIAMPIVAAGKDYLKWLSDETLRR